MSGPSNFLRRVNAELQHYKLPCFRIINPHPKQLKDLYNDDWIKVGRLDGTIYYKLTSINLYNLVRQRREHRIELLKSIPDPFTLCLNSPINSYLNRASGKILQKADIIIFQSELSRQMHRKFFGDAKQKSYVILNGVPVEIFNPDVKSEKLKGSPRLVITASFRLHKRLQNAIELINNLRKKLPGITLHVIGVMDNLTEEHIQLLDLSSCIFHGHVDSSRLPSIYAGCDLGLSPSLFDPCPNSVVEMVACGLPVLTTSASGAAEIIKNPELIIAEDLDFDFMELQTAEAIPVIDISAWSEAVVSALDNRINLSHSMLRRVEEEIDIKIVAKRYANAINGH